MVTGNAQGAIVIFNLDSLTDDPKTDDLLLKEDSKLGMPAFPSFSRTDTFGKEKTYKRLEN